MRGSLSSTEIFIPMFFRADDIAVTENVIMIMDKYKNLIPKKPRTF
jgi:hypothetical protein